MEKKRKRYEAFPSSYRCAKRLKLNTGKAESVAKEDDVEKFFSKLDPEVSEETGERVYLTNIEEKPRWFPACIKIYTDRDEEAQPYWTKECREEVTSSSK